MLLGGDGVARRRPRVRLQNRAWLACCNRTVCGHDGHRRSSQGREMSMPILGPGEGDTPMTAAPRNAAAARARSAILTYTRRLQVAGPAGNAAQDRLIGPV